MSTNLYFTANNYFNGKELWRVNPDGSVSLVADINPGTGSSNPGFFTPFLGELYFQATGVGGNELYKVAGDGNVVQVADINLGPDDSGPQDFIEYNGELYFTAVSATAGAELWKVAADGTVHQVTDILPGSGWGLAGSGFIVFNGELYFTPRNPTNTFNELWKVKADGTIAQVSALQFADTNAGSISSSDYDFRIFNGELYFTATTTAEGLELYKVKADGSVALVADINPGGASGPDPILPFLNTFESNGELYFAATSPDGGFEPWKITAAGTAVRVADINPGTVGSNPDFLGTAGGELYFSATTATAGNELWKVTAAGTAVQVVDLNPGTAGSNPSNLTTANGITYFNATTAANGSELWKINPDGSVSLAIDLRPGPNNSLPVIKAVIGGEIYFAAGTTETVDGSPTFLYRLWKLTADGQIVLAHDQAQPDSNSGQYPIYNGEAYFTANSVSHGTETWKIKSDGSIVEVADINQTINATRSGDATSFNGKFYFSAESSSGLRLWSLDSNGVATQTPDIDLGAPNLTYRTEFIEHAGTLYFNGAHVGDNSSDFPNRELWKVQSDGSVIVAAEINTNVTNNGVHYGSNPTGFTAFNGEIYFSAGADKDPVFVEPANFELWKFTSTGAVVLAGDINIGSDSSSPDHFFTFNNHLYFDAFTTASGRELWSVDTSGTIQQVADINPGSSGSETSPGEGLVLLGAFNGAYYFAARTDAAGRELWRVKSDGTVELAADLTPGAGDSVFHFLSEPITVFNREGYLTGGNRQFYNIQADGTVVAITVPNRESFIGGTFYTEFNGELYFRAATPSLNAETWKIKADGTPVFVSSQGPSSEYIPFGGSLYFMSEIGTDGLWKLDADGSVHLVSTAVTELNQYSQFGNKLLLEDRSAGLFVLNPDGTVSNAIPGTYTDVFGTHNISTAFGAIHLIGETGGVFYFSGTNDELAGPSIYGLTADGRLIVTTGTPNNSSPASEFGKFIEFTPGLPGSATAPTITSNGGGATASVSVAENSAAVTTVAASDPDTGTTLTYSIVGGADQFKFQINGTSGALSFIAAPNFEAPGDADANNSYIVQVRASDGSLFDDQTITVNVADVNEGGGNQPPAITSNGGGATASVSVTENSAAVTTVAASDPDAGTTLTYSIVGGADQGKFQINGSSGALSFIAAPDFEAPADAGFNNSYLVQVRASDGSLFDDQALTVAVTDVDEQQVNLTGTPDDDSFTALSGNERIDALGGIDTITFGFRLVDATVTYSGNQVIIDGPSSHTVLTGFEAYVFTDGTVNNNDGSWLIDDLYYYSQYHDVWNAQVEADVHFNLWGWGEFRNPNAFFDTNLYLSIYQDVKTAGVNPLTEFDTSGWMNHRIPSFNFDPDRYLIDNPDVAAAHIDPLEHFLHYGAGEGRQPAAPTELIAPNGFDYVYYLQHNPDVAAAHVDPFEHFQSNGWKEGRDPNALFDTSGYLATHADVAAANVNPLDHYHNSGWTEGRDPSIGFDTTSYLAAYPDVTAAHIDPLKHFLQSGIHEGRAPFADGVWG